jgi:predicted P-loop ATPase
MNVLTQDIETDGRIMQQADYDRLYIELGDMAPDKYIKSMVSVMADDNKYNPLQDWINGIIDANAWDGTDWIHKLAEYFTNPDGMFEIYLKKWMIGAVDRVMKGGERNPMMVLNGGQMIGKSQFVRWLCPEHLKDYYDDGQIYVGDKDYRMKLGYTFIWEVGEVDATTNRQDAAALKDFLTKQSVKDRRAYAEVQTKQSTITSFIGTFNDIYGFLNDASGSTRFRICEVTAINWFGYTTDPDDLRKRIWEQAVALWLRGETNELSAEEKERKAEIDKQYIMVNNTLFALEEYFEINPDTKDFTSSNYIREILSDHGLKGADLDAKRIASCLKTLGCKSGLKKTAGQVKRGWFGISKKLDAEL